MTWHCLGFSFLRGWHDTLLLRRILLGAYMVFYNRNICFDIDMKPIIVESEKNIDVCHLYI